MPERLKVAIAGINGRMGKASAQALVSVPDFELVGAFGKREAEYVGKPVHELIGVPAHNGSQIRISKDLGECLSINKPDVLLDFTEAHTATYLGVAALQAKIRVVSGTSGFTPDLLKKLETAAQANRTGALIVPNFSIGAIMMMHFAKEASQFFSDAEIVEIHQAGKRDAPSGTAMHTAAKMGTIVESFNRSAFTEKELVANARGGKFDNGLRVHSLRLPGILSRQEVLFGSEGELLSVKHESFNTKCFIKGIFLALHAVMELSSLMIGLDQIVLSQLEKVTSKVKT